MTVLQNLVRQFAPQTCAKWPLAPLFLAILNSTQVATANGIADRPALVCNLFFQSLLAGRPEQLAIDPSLLPYAILRQLEIRDELLARYRMMDSVVRLPNAQSVEGRIHDVVVELLGSLFIKNGMPDITKKTARLGHTIEGEGQVSRPNRHIGLELHKRLVAGDEAHALQNVDPMDYGGTDLDIGPATENAQKVLAVLSGMIFLAKSFFRSVTGARLTYSSPIANMELRSGWLSVQALRSAFAQLTQHWALYLWHHVGARQPTDQELHRTKELFFTALLNVTATTSNQVEMFTDIIANEYRDEFWKPLRKISIQHHAQELRSKWQSMTAKTLVTPRGTVVEWYVPLLKFEKEYTAPSAPEAALDYYRDQSKINVWRQALERDGKVNELKKLYARKYQAIDYLSLFVADKLAATRHRTHVLMFPPSSDFQDYRYDERVSTHAASVAGMLKENPHVSIHLMRLKVPFNQPTHYLRREEVETPAFEHYLQHLSVPQQLLTHYRSGDRIVIFDDSTRTGTALDAARIVIESAVGPNTHIIGMVVSKVP